MKTKNIELETMRNEREQEISQNLEEIQKIEKNCQQSIFAKDMELERLTQMVDYINVEISEKNTELEQLYEENQKYLDIIIKNSLSGIGSKHIR